MSGLPVEQATARGARSPRRTPRLTQRHVVLIVLVPVLVAVWIPVMTGGRRAPPVAPPAATALAVPPRAATDPGDTTLETAAPPPAPGLETALVVPTHSVVANAGTLTYRLRALTTPFTPRWTPGAGDPFAIAAPVPSSSPQDLASVPRPELAGSRNPTLVPTAVLMSIGQEPMAIIGGRSYRPGDDIAGHRIVAIEERRVVFRRGDATFSVSIPTPTFGQEQDHD
jgi:hypothetical protein